VGRGSVPRVHVQKKVVRAAEQNRPDVRAAREAWAAEVLPSIDPNRVAFVDEMGASTKLDRTHGYAPKGEPVVGRVPHGHYKNLTFTAALRSDGLVAGQVLDGPMTGDRFVAYVEHVLVPTLRAGDVVVLDNLPCHKRVRVREVVEAVGCRLLFLPAYSPDLNPIEMAFAKLKRVLRTDAHRTVPQLEIGLRAARTAFRAAECANYIRHCGYGNPATPPPNRH
jgi:transposase